MFRRHRDRPGRRHLGVLDGSRRRPGPGQSDGHGRGLAGDRRGRRPVDGRRDRPQRRARHVHQHLRPGHDPGGPEPRLGLREPRGLQVVPGPSGSTVRLSFRDLPAGSTAVATLALVPSAAGGTALGFDLIDDQNGPSLVSAAVEVTAAPPELVHGPRVVSAHLVVSRGRETGAVLAFDSALNPVDAADPSAYTVGPAAGRVAAHPARRSATGTPPATSSGCRWPAAGRWNLPRGATGRSRRWRSSGPGPGGACCPGRSGGWPGARPGRRPRPPSSACQACGSP